MFHQARRHHCSSCSSPNPNPNANPNPKPNPNQARRHHCVLKLLLVVGALLIALTGIFPGEP